MGFRLLPQDPELGWAPYAYLIYAAFFVAMIPAPPAWPYELPLSLLGLAVFLALYFRGYWASSKEILWIILGITLIGGLLTPGNFTGGAFFIYAAAFAFRAGPPRLAAAILAAILAAGMALAAWKTLPVFAWLPILIFVPIIGGLNIHEGEIRKAQKALLRSQEEVERLAKVAERERIARDLHDLLGHSLSVIALKSELARKLALEQPEKAAAEMRDVESISRRALKEVRSTVTAYRQADLARELEGARAALTAAGVRFEIEGDLPELDPLREATLALAIREAVTNVVRHAQARTCHLRFTPRPEGLDIEIVDDGQGSGSEEGSGLTGMRERIAALGGNLQRNSEAGTRLRIHLPADPIAESPT